MADNLLMTTQCAGYETMATISIKSEVAGSVWKIEKSVGDAVSESDIIMILESMKMEIPVHASASGKIVEIRVRPEESVDEEQVLCLIAS